MTHIEVITPAWTAPARVHAAFTLRAGGVSTPPFNSLNLGVHVGDDPAAVAENRRRMREHLGLPVEPAWLQQVHGVGVANLDDATGTGDSARTVGAARTVDAERIVGVARTADAQRNVDVAPTADAAITRRSHRVCVIQVADCIPVLFAARDGTAVAAAHAGWRGLAAGVLDATVQRLREEFSVEPEGLCAWLGPGIAQSHFEVGDDVRSAFLAGTASVAGAAGATGAARATPAAVVAEAEGAAVDFLPNSRGRWQCNLYGLARRRLLALGVREISGGDLCTYADSGRFFSYRRDGQCGRMAALVWLG